MARQILRPATAFSLDRSRKSQGGRIESNDHLRFIRSLPCLVTGSRGRVEAAHIRYADSAHGKPGTPMARKPDDMWTVPLAPSVHRRQHSMNEKAFWAELGIDPLAVALKLHAATGDLELGMQIVSDARGNLAPWRTFQGD